MARVLKLQRLAPEATMSSAASLSTGSSSSQCCNKGTKPGA